MGVAGLWDVLKPAAETRSMTSLAITDGFLANPQGLRGFRIGIDASIWFFHAEYGREGENPVLRTLFFRCATLMKTTFLPLFVFDGPKRPDFKRGKKINKTGHKLIPGMKAIIEAFGFEWRMAPAEAEAELAYLNRAGIIDGVLSDDVDNFLFGATTVVRNTSNNLSGNRANPILNSQGKDDKNHTRLYRASKILSHPSVSLTRGGLILIGLLSGGDYAQAGLPGCGIATAHGLARCGFGDSLLEAAATMPRESLPAFLSTWRQDLRKELSTNSRGIIGRKLTKLAKEVPDSFPDIDILLSYTNPITSESLGRAAEKNLKLTWSKEPDVGKLAALCEFYFEWGYKEAIIKRFRTVLWHSVVLRILRRAVINADDVTSSLDSVPPATPSTPKKTKAGCRFIGTPSKMIAKQFSSLALDSPSSHPDSDDDEELLIIKIHSSRSHASTDGLLEYRLEVSPTQLVRLAEAGIKGIRDPPEKDEWASDEATADDDESDSEKKSKEQKPPPDPSCHLRLWMPACMVEIAEPDVVKEFKDREGKKAAKKKGKTRKEAGVVKKTGTKTSQPSKTLKINPPKQTLYQSDQSEDDERQIIDDMLARRPLSVLSSPSHASNTRKTKHQPLQREEKEKSGSDIAIPKPTSLTRHVAIPSKVLHGRQPPQREESEESGSDIGIMNLPKHVSPTRHAVKPKKVRQNRQPSVLESLSVLDASERNEIKAITNSPSRGHSIAPAPFPISLTVDDDVFSSSDALILPSLPRALKRQTRDMLPLEPEALGSPPKSPRRTRESDLHNRPVSPSPMRPCGKLQVADISIIELSSNDSDDSESLPAKQRMPAKTTSVSKCSNVQPLIIARAKAANKPMSQTTRAQASNVQRTLIDLT